MATGDGRTLVTANSAEGDTVVRDARTLRALRRVPVSDQYTALSPATATRCCSAGPTDPCASPICRPGRSASPPAARRRGRAWHLHRRRSLRHHRRHRWPHHRLGRPPRRQGEVLTGHHGRITALAVSRDDSTLYSSALDGEVLIWDLAGSASPRAARSRSASIDLGNLPRYALSPDGGILAVGRPDGRVGVFDMRTLRPCRCSAWFPGRSGRRGHGLDPAQRPDRRRRRRWLPRGRRSAARPSRQASVRPRRARPHGERGRRLHAWLQRGRAPHGDRRGRRHRSRLVGAVRSGGRCADEVRRGWSRRRRRRVDEPRWSGGSPSTRPQGTDYPGVQIFDVATHRRVAALSDDEDGLGVRALHAGRSLHRRRQLEGLGPTVVDEDVEAGDAASCAPTLARWSGNR